MMAKLSGLGLVIVLAAMAVGVCVRPAGAQERDMTTVYLVLLRKGPSWTAGETPAIAELQKQHMANIRALFKAHKLVIAGPIDDQTGDLRGIFILEAASLDEAKALVATDPGVKAGRIAAVIYPWWVEKGALPEAGTYCSPPSGR
jgi:uncharacterized protein YciI